MKFNKTEDGRISFSDTGSISYNQWVRITKKLNHLGYEFDDPNDVKAYFDRGGILNKDQSIVVLEVLRNQKPNTLYPQEQITRDINIAIEIFGTTSIWNKAGYLTPNGELIDFSEGQWNRTLDHRSIHQALYLSLPEDHGYSEPMIQFINYGNIRTMNNGFEMSTPPTDKQKQILAKFLRGNDNIYVDIMNNNGHVSHHMEYEIVTSVAAVFADIDNYFKSIE